MEAYLPLPQLTSSFQKDYELIRRGLVSGSLTLKQAQQLLRVRDEIEVTARVQRCFKTLGKRADHDVELMVKYEIENGYRGEEK